MKSNKIGVGLIGASEGGWAVNAHLPALMSLKNLFEVIAVSTTNLATARATAEEFNIPNAFDNEFDLVNLPEIDLVVVTVKVPYHYQLVKTALKAGKMVYCEWPLGNGTKEAIELAELAREKSLKTFTGLQARSLPQLKYLRDFIAAGRLGKILSSTVIGSGGNWGATVQKEGLVYLLDPKNGATMLQIPFGHTIDALTYCLGEFKEVSATLAHQNKEALVVPTNRIVPQLSYDQIMVNGTLGDGAAASIHFRGGSSANLNFYWEIKGSDGEIFISSTTGNLQFGRIQIQIANSDKQLKEFKIPSEYESLEGGDPGFDAPLSYGVFYAFKAVWNDIVKNTTTVPSFEDGIIRHELLDRIEKASLSGIRNVIG